MRKFKKNLLKIMSSFILGSIAISPTFISTGCGSSNNNPSVIHPTSVTLDKKDLFIEVGAKQKLTATVKPDNATNKSVTWSSADEKIANVDKNGNVTGVKEGTTTVTVKTTDGSLTSTCNVTVSLSHASSVMVQPSDVSLPIVNNYQLESTFPPLEAVNNVDASLKIFEVLAKLPKEKARKYQQERNDALAKINRRSYSDISRIFDELAINEKIYNSARVEANQIIERQNEILRRKREVAPFWASIVIVFTPACNKYNEDKKKEQLKIQEDNDKILEKI